jgi:hypothetical protein
MDMKNVLNTTLFGAALLVAAAGFAQSSTSPQKGDEDRIPTTSPSTSGSSTDANTTGSTSGSTYGSTSGSTTGATGSTGATGTTGTAGTTGTYGTTGATGSTYGSSTTAPRTYSGTVKTINAGRTLVITMANGRTQTFDISGSPTIDTSVAVGSRVRVKQSVDASGHKVVTVEPYR